MGRCDDCMKTPVHPDKKCCFNCARVGPECEVWHNCGEDCTGWKSKVVTNAQKIRSMSDEELAEFLTHINPTNCQDCAFSHGWRCQPDRDDYSDFEKCKEGRKRWLKQPAKGE